MTKPIPIEDMISQQDAMKVLGVSRAWFNDRRAKGIIKLWKPISGARNIIYSKKELSEIINLKP